jgi:hypothetical protein
VGSLQTYEYSLPPV